MGSQVGVALVAADHSLAMNTPAALARTLTSMPLTPTPPHAVCMPSACMHARQPLQLPAALLHVASALMAPVSRPKVQFFKTEGASGSGAQAKLTSRPAGAPDDRAPLGGCILPAVMLREAVTPLDLQRPLAPAAASNRRVKALVETGAKARRLSVLFFGGGEGEGWGGSA